MQNKLSEFLALYKSHDAALYFIDNLVGKTQGKFTNKSGECTTLALDVHEAFQQACFDMLQLNSTNYRSWDIKIQREGIKKALFYKTAYFIGRHTNIVENADFTNFSIADEMIEKVFTPIISAADEVNSNQNHNNEASFVKNNLILS